MRGKGHECVMEGGRNKPKTNIGTLTPHIPIHSPYLSPITLPLL